MNLTQEQKEKNIVGDIAVPARFINPHPAKRLGRLELVERYQAAIAACDVPTGQPLVAVTAYYNPVGYFNRFYNYWEFALSLARQGVELVTAEVVHDQQHIPGSLQLPTSHVMWHKERAINLAVEQLPASCKYVAWLDCDLIWPTPWYYRALEKLQDKPVIQLFEKILFLNQSCLPNKENPRYGFARAYGSCQPAFPSSNHPPGGAWAAHRMLFDRFGGLYDRLTSGGADCLCAGAFTRAGLENPVLANSNAKVVADFAKYAKDVGAYVRGDVGWTDDVVMHLWHGDRENKQYQQRMSYMLDFDPHKSITVGPHGLYEWVNKDRSLNFLKYFRDRKEDA